MIEKLPLNVELPSSVYEACKKINEIIDVVNRLDKPSNQVAYVGKGIPTVELREWCSECQTSYLPSGRHIEQAHDNFVQSIEAHFPNKPIRMKEEIFQKIQAKIDGDTNSDVTYRELVQEYARSCVPEAHTAPILDYSVGYNAAVEEMKKNIG